MEDKARHINFNKFIEERSVEIAKFLVDLELDTKKKGHQALPKSIRRRAMSHNRYRIPRRLRKTMEEELAKAQSMQKLPKCRKHIRKRPHLISAYKMRSQKVQWLSTHLWAARRMRMINYYGFKVAQSPNNKSFRSSYRFTKHGCILTDISYYHSITLVSNQNVLELPPLLKLTTRQFPVSGKFYEGLIVNQDSVICPCFLIRSQAENITIRIFFHPAAVSQVMKLGVPQGWQAKIQQGQTDIYCLSGPQALSILQQAFQQYGIIQKPVSIYQQFYARQKPAIYFNLPNNNYAFSNKPLIDAPIPQEKVIAKGYKSDSNANIRAKMMQLFESLKENEIKTERNESQEAFWKMFDLGQNHEAQNTIFKITLRSRYTHRRKNKLSKEEKKLVIRSQRESSEEKGTRKKKYESSEGQNSYQERRIYVQTPINKKDAFLEPVYPLLVTSSKGSFFVFANNANSCRLWRIMSQLNVKVVGRQQANHYYLENGIRAFPQDFSETLAYQADREQKVLSNFQKYLRLPLPKRPNYLKLNSPHPFAPMVPIKPVFYEIQIVSKGHCEACSYVCELRPQDLAKVSRGLESGQMGIVHSEQGEGQRKKYKQYAQMRMDLQKLSPSRRIIGSITSGGYRYSRSREGGIGFIDQTLLSEGYFQNFSCYLLVRKTNSPHYMLAHIVKLIDNQ